MPPTPIRMVDYENQVIHESWLKSGSGYTHWSLDTPRSHFLSVRVYSWKWYACDWNYSLMESLAFWFRVIIVEKAKRKPLKLPPATSNPGQDSKSIPIPHPKEGVWQRLLPALKIKGQRSGSPSSYLHLIHQSDPCRNCGSWRMTMDYWKGTQVVAPNATAVIRLVSFPEQMNVATTQVHGVWTLIWWMHSFQSQWEKWIRNYLRSCEINSNIHLVCLRAMLTLLLLS